LSEVGLGHIGTILAVLQVVVPLVLCQDRHSLLQLVLAQAHTFEPLYCFSLGLLNCLVGHHGRLNGHFGGIVLDSPAVVQVVLLSDQLLHFLIGVTLGCMVLFLIGGSLGLESIPLDL